MFKFGDFVNIKTGFYEGCKGFLTGYEKETELYTVEITKMFKGIELREDSVRELEENLEKIDE